MDVGDYNSEDVTAQSQIIPDNILPRYVEQIQDDVSAYQSIYGTLNSDVGEFRLLVLFPSTNDASPLECQLRTATFSDPEAYDALSYVWGEAKFTASIQLNSVPFLITPRLEEALQYLGYCDKPRVLWVDALCINQRNSNELRYQVGLMRQIYTNCKSGVVWLGPDEGGVLGRAMTLLTKMEGCDIESLGYQGNIQKSGRRNSLHKPEVLYKLSQE
ncbi:hypothetical protein ONS95_012627 [Cadophora gregata]|uniref:uncharacterized protein n=1 Tax=Cadophora gregata TaxID=51156 RepID=UPI0026DA9127|nr:uncharacterized protein ONS95_012627 [Cadophora gregata]KAK0118337.1 hypothetical protein ONS95_012627 [Cadophora gregata]KAK0123407.1 hypothetical protein ONS96_010393 [Cadophora gregata f. sp. sojae]